MMSEETMQTAPEAVDTETAERHVRPISELLDAPDFPKSTVGEWVNIGGTIGQVTAVAGNSLKLQSSEGDNQSYNFHVLRKLYGRAPEPLVQPAEPERTTEPAAELTEAEEAEEEEFEPDFSREVRPIGEFVKRDDFPECVLGEHVDVGGYAGVVVEIINQSLRITSPEGEWRRYNADVLRKLHGNA